MAHEYTTWAYATDIEPAGRKFILVALADRANGDGYSFPGQKTLAGMTGQKERSVRQHLAWLVLHGYVKRRPRRRKDGTRTSDGYWLPPIDSTGRIRHLWPTGESRQANRQISPESPAEFAGHELSVEPPEEEPKPMSAAPTPQREQAPPPRKEPITREHIERIVAIYNEHCDVLPSVQAVNSARAQRVRKIIKEHGFDAACDLIRRATLAVAHDDFWRSRRKYGFDNLLAGDKYLQKAETWRDGGEVGVDVREGSRVLFKVTVGMTETEVPGEVVAVEDKQYVVRPEGAGDAPLPLSGDLSDTMRIPHSHVIRRL